MHSLQGKRAWDVTVPIRQGRDVGISDLPSRIRTSALALSTNAGHREDGAAQAGAVIGDEPDGARWTGWATSLDGGHCSAA